MRPASVGRFSTTSLFNNIDILPETFNISLNPHIIRSWIKKLELLLSITSHHQLHSSHPLVIQVTSEFGVKQLDQVVTMFVAVNSPPETVIPSHCSMAALTPIFLTVGICFSKYLVFLLIGGKTAGSKSLHLQLSWVKVRG